MAPACKCPGQRNVFTPHRPDCVLYDNIDRVSTALQEANQSYRGNSNNLWAYWRHLAKAAIEACSLPEVNQ